MSEKFMRSLATKTYNKLFKRVANRRRYKHDIVRTIHTKDVVHSNGSAMRSWNIVAKRIGTSILCIFFFCITACNTGSFFFQNRDCFISHIQIFIFVRINGSCWVLKCILSFDLFNFSVALIKKKCVPKFARIYWSIVEHVDEISNDFSFNNHFFVHWNAHQSRIYQMLLTRLPFLLLIYDFYSHSAKNTVYYRNTLIKTFHFKAMPCSNHACTFNII